MKNSPPCFLDILKRLEKDVRYPIGEAMVMVQKIRAGKVLPENLEKHCREILGKMVSADAHFASIFRPYNKFLDDLPVVKACKDSQKAESSEAKPSPK